MYSFSRNPLLPLVFSLAALLGQAALAAPPVPLKLPSFDGLAAKAISSVNVTLDGALLSTAAAFLDSSDPDDAAAKQVISGLKGIYVRSYTFDSDFAYPVADVDAVRKQLSAPGWQQIVSTHNNKDHTKVDIYLSVENGLANGLAIISSDPREFTIVNIVGSIDLVKLRELQGKLGIPSLPDEDRK